MTRQEPNERREADFESVYNEWQAQRINQRRAAEILGVSVRTFRRWTHRYREGGLAELEDKRKTQPIRKASPEEVESLERLYSTQYLGWSVQHFYEHYVERGGQRSYTWVNDRLKASGLVGTKPRSNGEHPAVSDSSTDPREAFGPKSKVGVAGALLAQNVVPHEWVPSQQWSLVATVDSFTNGVYSGFLAKQADIWSAFRGVREVLERYGFFDCLIENRAFFGRDSRLATAESTQLSQFRRAMGELGIELVVHRSRRSQSRMARFARTIRERLPRELASARITEREDANAFLDQYWSRFNQRFAAPLDGERKTAFDPLDHAKIELHNVLCLKESLQVDWEGYVLYRGRHLRFDGKRLREDSKNKARVHEYRDGSRAVYQGRRLVGRIDAGLAD